MRLLLRRFACLINRRFWSKIAVISRRGDVASPLLCLRASESRQSENCDLQSFPLHLSEFDTKRLKHCCKELYFQGLPIFATTQHESPWATATPLPPSVLSIRKGKRRRKGSSPVAPIDRSLTHGLITEEGEVAISSFSLHTADATRLGIIRRGHPLF